MTSGDSLTNPVPEFVRTGLQDEALKQRVNALRLIDNRRNWGWLAGEYFYLAAVLGSALAFHHYRAELGLGWGWTLPVALMAIFLVGIGQHRLAMLGHEASHYLLFRNRLLNELAGNWLCFFPMWGVAHHFRIQHFAHHQFVNDPELDPATIEMMACANRFRHPMPFGEFIWHCVIRLIFSLPALLHYTLFRARYAALGECPPCYRDGDTPPKLVPLLNSAHLLLLLGGLTLGLALRNPWVLGFAPAGLLAGYTAAVCLIPARYFLHTRFRSVIAPRWIHLQRAIFVTLLLSGLYWLQALTAQPWTLYYLILWLVPLATSFPYFMILREDIQHANCEHGAFSHTRNFQGHRLIKWAVFPYHMGYHLPHHLYPSVPHYNLPKLDEILRKTDAYERGATVVKGYLLPR